MGDYFPTLTGTLNSQLEKQILSWGRFFSRNGFEKGKHALGPPVWIRLVCTMQQLTSTLATSTPRTAHLRFLRWRFARRQTSRVVASHKEFGDLRQQDGTLIRVSPLAKYILIPGTAGLLCSLAGNAVANQTGLGEPVALGVGFVLIAGIVSLDVISSLHESKRLEDGTLLRVSPVAKSFLIPGTAGLACSLAGNAVARQTGLGELVALGVGFVLLAGILSLDVISSLNESKRLEYDQPLFLDLNGHGIMELT